MGLFNAIGDWATGGGLIGALSGAQDRKQSKKAVQAVQDAADKNRALYQNIYDTTRGDLSEYRDLGSSGVSGLRTALNLGGPATARPPAAGPGPISPATAPPKTQGGPAGTSPPPSGPAYPGAPQTTPAGGGEPDWQAYLAANPDVAGNAQQRMQTEQVTPEQVAQQHWEAYGQKEGRQLPTAAVTGGDVVTPDLLNGQRPDAIAPPEFTRPQDQQAPDLNSYFTNFEADPGYDFRVKEALKGVNAASAARGKLRSGDAAKALQDRASSLADQAYDTWYQQRLQRAGLDQSAYQYGQNRSDTNFAGDRSYGTNVWDTLQKRSDNVFDVDRGFQAQRYDQNIANLFGLTGIGANAAAGTAAAGNVFANATANQNDSVATARANAALTKPNPFANLLKTGAQVAGAYAGGGTF